MAASPRHFQHGVVYDCVQRTVDRQFLFNPDPVIISIIGACAARAMAVFPVLLHWLEININHEHMGISAISSLPEHLNNLFRFRQLFHSTLTREINAYLEREGALFSSRSRITPCVDDAAAERQMFYAMTNPAKDGLVDSMDDWPGFSTFRHRTKGEDMTFTYFDRKEWNAQKRRKSARPLEAFEKTVTLKISPLPHLAKKKPRVLARRIALDVRALEAKFREERARDGLSRPDVSRLLRINPRQRPATPAVRSRKPLCHASSAEAAAAYQQLYKEFRAAYRAASAAYLAGDYHVPFPAGSIRPPLIVLAA